MGGNAKIADGWIGGRKLIWVHSHQVGVNEPCIFVCNLKEAADEKADRAALSREDIPISDVKYPTGLPRFLFSYKASAVVENVGKFIRIQGCNG